MAGAPAGRVTMAEIGADAFGQRSIADLVGEATYRTFLGSIRPLWHDLPEVDKAVWRQAGLTALRSYCRGHAKPKKRRSNR